MTFMSLGAFNKSKNENKKQKKRPKQCLGL